jgi:hypothetical protein
MWLSDAQSESALRDCSLFRHFDNILRVTEIGVALTSFGALFMVLGVIMFFDGALLALGNVCALRRLT